MRKRKIIKKLLINMRIKEKSLPISIANPKFYLGKKNESTLETERRKKVK
jgi:hypothetical protein